jgi:hypothetical protein
VCGGPLVQPCCVSAVPASLSLYSSAQLSIRTVQRGRARHLAGDVVSAVAAVASLRVDLSHGGRAADPTPHAPRYIQAGPAGRHVEVLRRHLNCYLCGANVGYLDTLAGSRHVRRLWRADGRVQPLPVQGRLPRCCFCGGSLYLDEAESSLLWPKVAIGHEKPGRKPRGDQVHADLDAVQ